MNKTNRSNELILANKELAFQNEEKEKRAQELIIANKELAFQNREKEKRAEELIVANKELAFQNQEKEKRAVELTIANKELAFQNQEKAKRASELIIANLELALQNEEKEKRAIELTIANEELAFQNEEKVKRASELTLANKELAFQNEEKVKRAAELTLANKELAFQNNEKGKRAAELTLANRELAFQNEEKGKRASELTIANKELAFQNEEKGKRASELTVANQELAFQNEEKEKRASELTVANQELAFQNEEKEKRAAELITTNQELKTAEEKILKVSHLYAFISQVNQNITRENDEAMLFRNSCRMALKFGKFKMAWIGLFDHTNKQISLAEQCGIPAAEISLFANVSYRSKGPQEYVLHNDKHYISNDIQHDLELPHWKPFAQAHSINSCMILPIKKSGNIIGTLNLYATELNFTGDEEIALLVEATGDISFALDMFEKAKKHKDAEEQIILNERRFRALIEKGVDLIALRSPEGKFIYASPSITVLLGYTLDELFKISVFDLIHPVDLPGLQEQTQAILKTPGSSFFRQQRYLHKNGSVIWCEGSVTNMLDEPGIHALVSNFRDISARKKAEKELEKMSIDIIQRSKNLEQFAYIVSHNLRAPVANILGFSNVLKGTLTKVDQNKTQQFLFQAVRQLDEIIIDLNGILQTRTEITENIRPVHLQDLVSDIESSMQNLIQKENVQILTDFSGIDTIKTLKGYFRSIFYNLISNSIKYRQPGITPIIRIKSEKIGRKASVSFSDNGRGIDLKQHGEKVFGLYKRFHPTIEGKGLGLYMVKTQVEVLGGSISIQSEPNKGTEFIIEVPL